MLRHVQLFVLFGTQQQVAISVIIFGNIGQIHRPSLGQVGQDLRVRLLIIRGVEFIVVLICQLREFGLFLLIQISLLLEVPHNQGLLQGVHFGWLWILLDLLDEYGHFGEPLGDFSFEVNDGTVRFVDELLGFGLDCQVARSCFKDAV